MNNKIVMNISQQTNNQSIYFKPLHYETRDDDSTTTFFFVCEETPPGFSLVVVVVVVLIPPLEFEFEEEAPWFKTPLSSKAMLTAIPLGKDMSS